MTMGKGNSIVVDGRYRTSIPGVYAAGDVTTGETLVVKAMSEGREAAQRIHEFVMSLGEEKHTSLFETYFESRATREFYDRMLASKDERFPLPA
jgi:pyruvate/2-oxoglutarate dehydrogenase complex dihydrolipoamide dehydrogenase (E3) component